MSHIINAKQVGRIIAARRKALSRSQQELAAQLGISQNRLSELETHSEALTLERLLALLNILGLEMHVGEKSSTSPSKRVEW